MLQEIDVLKYRDKNEFPSILSLSILHCSQELKLLVTTNKSLSLLHSENGLFRLIVLPLAGINLEEADLLCSAAFFRRTKRQEKSLQPIVAVAYNIGQKPYLNIYSSWPHSNCTYQVFELLSFPVKLIYIETENKKLQAFLICGSSQEIQLYSSIDHKHKFTLLSEQTTFSYFPQLQVTNCIMCFEIRSIKNKKIMVIGQIDGKVQVYCINPSVEQVNHSIYLDGPISSVLPFNLHIENEKNILQFDLLVTSTTGYAWKFSNVATCGFSNSHFLLSSDHHNAILTASLCDISMNGSDEILLGCYDGSLLGYLDENKEEEKKNTLLWKKKFSSPVYSICCGDFNKDGIDEVIVATKNGIHILFPDFSMINKKVSRILDILSDVC